MYPVSANHVLPVEQVQGSGGLCQGSCAVWLWILLVWLACPWESHSHCHLTTVVCITYIILFWSPESLRYCYCWFLIILWWAGDLHILALLTLVIIESNTQVIIKACGPIVIFFMHYRFNLVCKILAKRDISCFCSTWCIILFTTISICICESNFIYE